MAKLHPKTPNPTFEASSITPPQKNNKILRRNCSSPCPASFAQTQFWLLQQLNPHSSVYNLNRILKFYRTPNLNALKLTLEKIIERHEVLRTKFSMQNGELMQIIMEPSEVLVDVVETANDRELQSLIDREIQTPFDLSQNAPVRCKLFQSCNSEYILLIVLHHIASDYWSIKIFDQEFIHFYQGSIRGDYLTLSELPVQYADFAVWQQQKFKNGEFDRQLEYWKYKLQGELPILNFPSYHSRPAIPSHSAHRQSVILPLELVESIKILSFRQNATLFMALLTAFNILLYRYTHQTDIIVGCPIGDRQNSQLESLIGCCINFLPIRTDISKPLTFRQLLHRVRTNVLEVIKNKDIPFEKIVREIQPQRHSSYSPIYQVLFNFINERNINTENEVFEYLINKNIKTDFDFTFTAKLNSQGLKLEVSYSTDLYEFDAIAALIKHYQILLESIVKNPDCLISELPILSPEETHKLLVEWNSTKHDFHEHKLIHRLFEEQVKRTPTHVAISFDGQELTYQELNSRANQLAELLRAQGVQAETLVGLFIERSLEMVIGILGILKAGGAYVPLDINHPQERLSFVISETQVPIILTQQSLVSKLPACSSQVICLDTDLELTVVFLEQQSNINYTVKPHNLAYVIYTSGSTGTPKGVQITHSNVANLLIAINKELALTNQDVLLSVTTLSFDISVLEIFLPLSIGAKVILVPQEASYDAQYLLGKISASSAARPTVMQATPATWKLLLQAGWTGNSQLKVLCGGEALSTELAQQLCDRSSSVWNLYGPTETTIWSTIAQVKPEASRITIGKPLANTQIYLLDATRQLVPIGASGEVYIGGAGLARGYLNQPMLSAQRFVPHPFSKNAEERLYKTGDLARYLPDGGIEFLGRLDRQVKIRGFRIELEEIEIVLRQHPTVQDTAVIVREDTPGQQQLVAYVVPKSNHFPQQELTDELRNFLKRKLPSYMLPSVFIFLETLPLNSNGKVERKALPKLNTQIYKSFEPNFVAPRTVVEKILAEIWQKVLALSSEIGVYDNFFDLGGHSLLSVQLIAEIETAFQYKIPFGTLFQLNTIAEMAKLIEQMEEQQPFEITTSLPREIYRYLFAYTAGWPVKRLHPHSLLFFLNHDGTKTPLFWCFQDFAEFYQLAHYLGREQPVYAMRSLYLVADYTPENVDALATHYVNEILEVQSEGDYLIGGICQGSQIALAIAQQLIDRGKTVKLLCLHEFYNPVSYPSKIALFFAKDSNIYQFYKAQISKTELVKLYPAGFSINLISGIHNNFLIEPHIRDFTTKLKMVIEQVQNEQEQTVQENTQDEQVKIRGVAIKLKDLEIVLNQHSDVQKCLVIAQKDQLGRHKQFIAYVSTITKQLNSNELRNFMRQSLPEYLVPSVFLPLESMVAPQN